MYMLQFLKNIDDKLSTSYILRFHFGYRIPGMFGVNVFVLPIKIFLGIFIIGTYPKKIGKYSGLFIYLSNFFLWLSL